MDWKHFFDRIGLDGTRWQWRIHRWQRRWGEWRAAAADRKRQVTYAHKVCPGCGALVSRSEAVCPSCQTSTGSWSGQVAGRAVQAMTPAGALVAPALLAANVVIAILTMAKPGTLPWDNLLLAGRILGSLLREGEWWRLVSYGSLHGNLLHVLFNMYALFQLGPIIEGEIGRRRFLSLYVLTLVAAGCATAFLRSEGGGGSIGASGAVFGLVGFGVAYTRVMGNLHYHQAFRSMALQSVIFGLYIQFFGGVGIDNLAHGGGFAAGLLLGWAMGREKLAADRGASPKSVESAWTWLAAGCLILTLASLAGMFAHFVDLLAI